LFPTEPCWQAGTLESVEIVPNSELSVNDYFGNITNMKEMLVRVKVVPGARKERVEKKSETRFVMHIKEKPEKNFANTKVKELLAQEYGVSEKQVRLALGRTGKSKTFIIRNH